MLTPSVEFLSKTFPEFHYVVEPKLQTTGKPRQEQREDKTWGCRRQRQQTHNNSSTGHACKMVNGFRRRSGQPLNHCSSSGSSPQLLLSPPPAETRLRPMDDCLRGLGRETVLGYLRDKRCFSRNDVDPQYKTKTKFLKRQLKKVRSANRRYARQFSKMKSAAESLNKFDKRLNMQPFHVEATAHGSSGGGADDETEGATIPSMKDGDEEKGESIKLENGTAESPEITDEIIRQATTRLSRAREQLRSSTVIYQRGKNMDQFLGIYDLPARPMTSSLRQRMIGGATRIDLGLDHINLGGNVEDREYALRNRKNVWMGLSPE